MRIFRLAALILLQTTLISFNAQAQTWDETTDGGGDAGQLLGTAQVPAGVGPLTTITGFHDGGDADLYLIQIDNPASFSASLASSFSSQLWLFDNAGNGIAHRDGAPKTLTSALVTSPGAYYIGTSYPDLDAASGGNQIWNDLPTGVERGPDGPGAAGTLDGWVGATPEPVEFYTLTLTGVRYVPEPTSAALLIVATLGGCLFNTRSFRSRK